VGLLEALGRIRSVLEGRRALAVGRGGWVERQEAYFRRFEW
jgi:N-acetylglucosaminyl-diphospho-decaprenol L-rhamnosyltransferase